MLQEGMTPTFLTEQERMLLKYLVLAAKTRVTQDATAKLLPELQKNLGYQDLGELNEAFAAVEAAFKLSDEQHHLTVEHKRENGRWPRDGFYSG